MSRDLTFFREQGYQVLPGVVDLETVQLLKGFLESEVDAALEETAVRFASRSEFVEKVDDICRTGRLDTYSREAQMIMAGHFPLRTRLSPELWRVPRVEAVRDVLQGALNAAELFMHMPPTARFVLPRNSLAAVPAHRDVSYNTHMTDFVIMWLPLTDIDDACGGVAVYEGSQYTTADPGGIENFWLKPVSVEGYRRVHCTMKMGDALLVGQTMLHSSVPNVSDRVRCSIDFRFFGSLSASSKHVLDLQQWKVNDPAATR